MLICQTGQQFILRETGLQLKLSRLCRLCAHPQAIYPTKKSTIRVSFARKGSHPPA